MYNFTRRSDTTVNKQATTSYYVLVRLYISHVTVMPFLEVYMSRLHCALLLRPVSHVDELLRLPGYHRYKESISENFPYSINQLAHRLYYVLFI